MSGSRVTIVEVAPRDGFQAVTQPIPRADKAKAIAKLKNAGLRRMEIGAFVNPKAVPQMTDTADLLSQFPASGDWRPHVLTANRKGAEAALKAGAEGIVFVISASEAHNQNNVRRSVAESLEEFAVSVDTAAIQYADRPVMWRLNVATAFDCPFAGVVGPEAVLYLIAGGLDIVRDAPNHSLEIGLCDTTGRAFPDQVAEIFRTGLERFGDKRTGGPDWAFHGHDTYGLGVANALYAHQAGVRVFDGSAAGLGGCPFAPGATGNTATEDLVFAFQNMDIETGVDLAALLEAADMIALIDPPSTGGHVRGAPRQRVLNEIPA